MFAQLVVLRTSTASIGNIYFNRNILKTEHLFKRPNSGLDNGKLVIYASLRWYYVWRIDYLRLRFCQRRKHHNCLQAVFTVRGDRVQTVQMLDRDKPVIIIDERRSRSSTSSDWGSYNLVYINHNICTIIHSNSYFSKWYPENEP